MPNWWHGLRRGALEVDAEVPASLKDKTPDQIAVELADLQRRSKELDDLKASSTQKDQQLTTATTELTQIRERIKLLEASGATPKPAVQQVTSVLEDEDKAFNERLRPFAHALMSHEGQTSRMVAEQRIRQNPVHSRLLTKYQKDVDALYATVPPEYQRFPETYQRVFSQVLGDHLEEIAADAAKAGGSFFVEPAGGASPQDVVSKGPTLTQDELDVAKKMKISPEAFLKSKTQMREVGGHISFERS